MNRLDLHTRETAQEGEFDTFWKTGQTAKGRVRVRIKPMEDARIAAELAALQFLLEDKEVCGRDKTGAGLVIQVSFGAIRKLMRADSEKEGLAPYATFLRTRFVGAEVQVENRRLGWVDEKCEERVDTIEVSAPRLPKIEIAGFGQVEMTGHAVEQFITRFGFQQKPEKAWRAFKAVAERAKLAAPLKRSPIHDVKHKRPGGFALNEKADLVAVVTPADGRCPFPRLVTVYRHSENPMRLIPLGREFVTDDVR